jgi:hypothetical protein
VLVVNLTFLSLFLVKRCLSLAEVHEVGRGLAASLHPSSGLPAAASSAAASAAAAAASGTTSGAFGGSLVSLLAPSAAASAAASGEARVKAAAAQIVEVLENSIKKTPTQGCHTFSRIHWDIYSCYQRPFATPNWSRGALVVHGPLFEAVVYFEVLRCVAGFNAM